MKTLLFLVKYMYMQLHASLLHEYDCMNVYISRAYTHPPPKKRGKDKVLVHVLVYMSVYIYCRSCYMYINYA